MERIRIDRRDLRVRARRREGVRADAAAPLQYRTPGGGPACDEELLARIDAALEMAGRIADDI